MAWGLRSTIPHGLCVLTCLAICGGCAQTRHEISPEEADEPVRLSPEERARLIADLGELGQFMLALDKKLSGLRDGMTEEEAKAVAGPPYAVSYQLSCRRLPGRKLLAWKYCHGSAYRVLFFVDGKLDLSFKTESRVLFRGEALDRAY